MAETQREQGKDQPPPRRAPMLHKVLNHAEHDFHQGKSQINKIDGTEQIHSASAMPWIIIPRAGIRTVEEKNLQTGKMEKVRKMTPGEVVLDDEQLDFLKASNVCSAWLKPEPLSAKPQVIVVDSYPDTRTAAEKAKPQAA